MRPTISTYLNHGMGRGPSFKDMLTLVYATIDILRASRMALLLALGFTYIPLRESMPPQEQCIFNTSALDYTVFCIGALARVHEW